MKVLYWFLGQISGWAESIALQIEHLLFWLFGGLYQTREKLLVSLIKKYWPKWLTANRLTVSRIIIGLIILAVLLFQSYQRNPIIIALLTIGLLTDLIDGIVARAFNSDRSVEDKALGSFIDKLADRVLYIPLAWFEYWHHPDFWIRFALITLTAGGIIVALWQFINWAREETREVPENFVSKLSAFCFVPVVVIPLIWPEQWVWGFYCSFVAGVLAIQSLWKGIKFLVHMLEEL